MKTGGRSGQRVGDSPSRAGFTLIELMVSAGVMSIILAAAYVCFRSGVSSQRLVEGRVDMAQNARVALAMLTADLRSACPLSKEREFLGMDRKVGEAEADNLDFGTHHYTPRREGEGDFCEVSYFLQETGPGLFSLWRRRNPGISPDPLSGGGREEIADGLRGLRFEYYDGLDWFDEWGDVDGRGKAATSLRLRSNLSGMPEAVRITLWFDPEQRPAPRSLPRPRNDEGGLPVMFQTIVRLNLAPLALEGTSSSGTSEGGSPSSGEAMPGAPSGGGRE
jgi:prepilin-type N-terminal cleavage/methylation domain-containing protein